MAFQVQMEESKAQGAKWDQEIDRTGCCMIRARGSSGNEEMSNAFFDDIVVFTPLSDSKGSARSLRTQQKALVQLAFISDARHRCHRRKSPAS